MKRFLCMGAFVVVALTGNATFAAYECAKITATGQPQYPVIAYEDGDNIAGAAPMLVNGQIEGELHCTSLIISQKAHVVGTTRAEKVVVDGKVEGPIRGDAVHLKSQVNVLGDISHHTLAIEKGARFGSLGRSGEGRRRHRAPPHSELLGFFAIGQPTATRRRLYLEHTEQSPVAAIEMGPQHTLDIGNLDAKRDRGHAKREVRGAMRYVAYNSDWSCPRSQCNCAPTRGSSLSRVSKSFNWLTSSFASFR